MSVMLSVRVDRVNYEQCCQPLHLGQERCSKLPTQLMRSRYSAFAKHEIDYIVQTTAIGPATGSWMLQPLREWSRSPING